MSHKKRKEAEILLSRFLDGELSPEQEKAALYKIADDEELRKSLRFDRYLINTLREDADFETFAVPDDFTDDVMSRIYEIDNEEAEETSWIENAIQTISGWFIPREFTFRPAMVYAVPAILLFAIAGLFQVSEQQEPTEFQTTGIEFISDATVLDSEEVWIRFIYIDDDAEQFAVAGDFSDWNPVEMSSQLMNGKKVWTGLIPVERGEHHYMFIKDGVEWLSDPLAEVQRDDGFGNKNAVIYL